MTPRPITRTIEYDMPVEDPENGFEDVEPWDLLPEMSAFSGRHVRVTIQDLGPVEQFSRRGPFVWDILSDGIPITDASGNTLAYAESSADAARIVEALNRTVNPK